MPLNNMPLNNLSLSRKRREQPKRALFDKSVLTYGSSKSRLLAATDARPADASDATEVTWEGALAADASDTSAAPVEAAVDELGLDTMWRLLDLPVVSPILTARHLVVVRAEGLLWRRAA
jgi:hypothetical protein